MFVSVVYITTGVITYQYQPASGHIACIR